MTGPLRLISHLTLNVEESATLQSMDRTQYIENDWKPEAFITGVPSDLALKGTGSIDGAGADWWSHTKDDRHYRPHLIKLHTIDELLVDGVRFANSPNHHVYVENCTHVRIRNMRVEAPSTSPNTDGINFSGGQDPTSREQSHQQRR